MIYSFHRENIRFTQGISVKYIKTLFLFLLIFSCLSFPLLPFYMKWKETIQGKEYTFEYLLDDGDLTQDKELSIRTFVKAYESIPTDTLQIPNVKEFIRESFEEEEARFNSKPDNFFYIRAKDHDRIVGLITVERNDKKKSAGCVRWLAVDLEYCGKGSGLPKEEGIGGRLISIIPMVIPTINHLCVHTRKCNSSGKRFYEKFGFKKIPTQTPHDGFDPNVYDTYEYSFNRNPLSSQ